MTFCLNEDNCWQSISCVNLNLAIPLIIKQNIAKSNQYRSDLLIISSVVNRCSVRGWGRRWGYLLLLTL